MPYDVTVDHPEAGDQDIYIHGLGSFRNGTTTSVSDEQAETYRALNAVQIQTHTENGGLIVESQLAPPIDQLDIRGVTIAAAGKESPPEKTAPKSKEPANETKGGEE